MNWKAHLLVQITALCLAVPSTFMLTLVEPLVGSANSHTKQTSYRPTRSLPLGSSNLTESRVSNQIARGVTHTVIVRGRQTEREVYTVDVSFQANQAAAETVAESLRSQGYEPRVQPILQRAQDDPESGALGYLVRVGAFSTEALATDLRNELAAIGYTGIRVVYTGEDGGKTTGPWVVNVLEIDPEQFQGTLSSALATEIIPGNERLTQLAARVKAIAAINGGYFVIGATDGTPGDLAGISIINERLVSEAVNGRTSLILPSKSGRNARIAALTSVVTAKTGDGVTREIDGLNRKPGLIRGCGGVGGDLPTENPKHDFTCTDSSELIQFTRDFGETTEAGEGAEVVLDASGYVIEFRQARGGQIPENGSVLSATGDAVEWLQTYAQPGAKIDIDTRVLANGEELPLEQTLGVINGGPRLLRNREIDITAFAEGFQWQENPEFYYRFGVRRNPRTLAGVTARGKLLLVTVDGRQPGWSVGATFAESAQIMRSLGATDAVNLDGGGSTTITINQQLVNRPSDATGERPIADAIIIRP
ncbi:phosphodiester glycosidase family protein [Iningainema tapete]|uniref:Phosphodiester glycosidase family protein n=1 Tax=Iningainema tapete BLCC-T55 TaxID=2748662 RepID=A0A8J7C9E6_9CYAN|nr:phosphodiester glycosidase family protein [Iningainema tapete]MBD2775846.1 phosphodiester glycosidase family protein [Iningainema tapete BLCC-T55]